MRGSAYGISVAPDDRRKIYVGTDFGIAISTDNGATWTHTEVETGPADPDAMQGSLLSVQALPGDRALALGRRGIHRFDAGTGWRNIRAGNYTFQAASS
jgi:photosystem II stability/assembly factor-like uncharacterized protein